MSRILTIIAALAILLLLVFVFSDRDPAEETKLPAVGTPDISLENELEPDAEFEVAPREGDPSLESEPVDVDVVRDSEEPAEVDVTVPEGEGRIDTEIEEAPEEAEELQTGGEPETETGDDQPPK